MCVTNGRISCFLWLNNILLCVCVCVCVHMHTQIFFIHSSTSEHLGRFYVLDIVTIAALNMVYRFFFKVVFVFLLDKCPDIALLVHMVVLLLISLRTLYSGFQQFNFPYIQDF